MISMLKNILFVKILEKKNFLFLIFLKNLTMADIRKFLNTQEAYLTGKNYLRNTILRLKKELVV